MRCLKYSSFPVGMLDADKGKAYSFSKFVALFYFDLKLIAIIKVFDQLDGSFRMVSSLQSYEC